MGSISCFHKTKSMWELKAFFLELFSGTKFAIFFTELELFTQTSLDKHQANLENLTIAIRKGKI